MYIDGQQVAVAIEAYFYPLSTVQDVNDWLGRANWGMDPFFGGSFNEFRIYDTMLGQLQVLVDYHCGPDLIGCSPETPTSITLNVISNMITGTVQDVTVTAVFPTYGTVTVGGSEVTITSSASNIVSVGTNNRLTAVSPGVATITASLVPQTNSATVTVAPPAVYTALKHRYSFNEPAGSTNVTDSIGGPLYNGIVYPPMTNTVAPVVISNGVANFPGGSYSTCGYIALPSYLISSGFTNITVEFWFTWNGGAAQQSVFDFGDSYKGNDPHVYSSGKDYIMFTPRRLGGNGGWSEFRAVDDGASFFSTICYQS